MSEDRAVHVNEFKQKHAATSIQRQWRNRKQQQEQVEVLYVCVFKFVGGCFVSGMRASVLQGENGAIKAEGVIEKIFV